LGWEKVMEVLWIILACGVGTFLLRWLPLKHARQQREVPADASVAGALLAGVGPAAISALFAVSVWGIVSADFTSPQLARTTVALAAVVIARMLARGGVAVPTLCGALIYGLLSGLQ
jgi:branched-subunit amino acid transport protein